MCGGETQEMIRCTIYCNKDQTGVVYVESEGVSGLICWNFSLRYRDGFTIKCAIGLEYETWERAPKPPSHHHSLKQRGKGVRCDRDSGQTRAPTSYFRCGNDQIHLSNQVFVPLDPELFYPVNKRATGGSQRKLVLLQIQHNKTSTN